MPSFLIVDDNPVVRSALNRAFDPYGACCVAESVTAAQSELESSKSWDGFVIDVILGDGSGIDLLAHARRTFADTPAVLLSGSLDREIVNRAAVLNARFLCKPCGMSEFAPFLSDVLARKSGDKIHAATTRALHRWNLSPREAEIVESALRGRPRDEYAKAHKISANTFKSHVRKLLEKTDHENVPDLVRDLLSEDL